MVSPSCPVCGYISVTELRVGLHFLPKAYKIMYNSMMELIRREWPDQDPENIPSAFPAWENAFN